VTSIEYEKRLNSQIASDNWNEHVNAISAEAIKRLQFLKLLKRFSAPRDDLLLKYKTVIRPIIKYARPAW
jgi:hypothetical protein